MRAIIIATALISATAAPAATLRVPSQYPSILAAVDAASAGDSVLVAPGTWVYRETRSVVVNGFVQLFRSSAFLKPGITLIGEAGAGATVIEADVSTDVPQNLLLVSDQSDKAQIIIEGFTVRGFGVPNVGISANNCGPIVVRSCTIENNLLGIDANRCDLELRDSIVRNNDAGGVPGVLASAVWGVNSNWTLEGTTFEGNSGPLAVYNEITTVDHTTTIADCRFVANIDAVPLDVRNQSLSVVGTVFVDNVNTSPTATALCVFECKGNLRGNTFANNRATGPVGIGAVEVRNSEVEVTENTFFGNQSPTPDFASAILVDSDVPWEFSGNVLAGSQGAPALSIHGFGSLQPSGGCNVLWDNPDGHYTGYIPKPDDLIVDPLFCGAGALDFTVRSDSPCAAGNTPGCQQIGAWGVGCGVVSLEAASWGLIKSFYRGEE